jgi:hypothetical protein
MDRRGFLRGAAALLAGGGLAGCTGNNEEVPVTAGPPPITDNEGGGLPGGGPGADGGSSGGDGGDGSGGDSGGSTATPQRFIVPNYDFQEGEDGALVVVMEIENRSSGPHSGVVRVLVPTDEETYERALFVELDAGASATYELRFGLSFERFMTVGGFQVEFDAGTPETPIPETTVPHAGTPTVTPSRTPTATPTAQRETSDGATSSAETTTADTETTAAE